MDVKILNFQLGLILGGLILISGHIKTDTMKNLFKWIKRNEFIIAIAVPIIFFLVILIFVLPNLPEPINK